VPIPFRDADDIEALGSTAFLKLERSENGAAYLGALLLINARGEPLEFTYNRVDLPQTFLWRAADLRRHAERTLTVSLLSLGGGTPRLLLCLADEVGHELFSQDIEVAIPVGRIGRVLGLAGSIEGETHALPEAPEPMHIFWYPEPPAEGSVERRLFERLGSHGLLLEPFERALIGLHEVYAGEVGEEFWT
jgi:hypothetical protein